MKKSSESTSRQFREKGTPVATKHREIVSLSCKKRNSNENSNEIPFLKITLPKIRILMAQYIDRRVRNRLPFKLLLEGMSVGTTSSSLERFITMRNAWAPSADSCVSAVSWQKWQTMMLF